MAITLPIVGSAEAPEPEFLILLMVTGAAFAVGLLISLAALISLRRNRSSKLWWIVAFLPAGCGAVVFAPFAFLLGSWILYWMLPQHVATKEEVTKEYYGKLYGAQEKLVLLADGTFTQIVDMPDNGEFPKEGKWTLKDNYVELDDCYIFYDNEHSKLLSEPRLMGGVMYRYYYGDKALIYDWDTDHYTLKQK